MFTFTQYTLLVIVLLLLLYVAWAIAIGAVWVIAGIAGDVRLKENGMPLRLYRFADRLDSVVYEYDGSPVYPDDTRDLCLMLVLLPLIVFVYHVGRMSAVVLRALRGKKKSLFQRLNRKVIILK